MKKSKVYFTKNISSQGLINLYNAVGKKLEGKVSVKVHSGEPGGNNYVKPNMMKDLVHLVKGTIVECNTAYHGKRDFTADHEKALKDHGFYNIANVDIMDSEGEEKLPVRNGKHLKFNLVGTHLKNYDSMLMLSHFKGHAMGGFGGALKNMSIGVASRNGKANIHSAGKTCNPDLLWSSLPEQDYFLESMAEADSTIIDFFKGNMVFIDCMINLSIDCDCDSHPEEPCMKDIGLLASLDPVALDKACMDLVEHSDDPGRDHFMERVNSRNGKHTIEYAEKIGLGTQNYQLIDIDK